MTKGRQQSSVPTLKLLPPSPPPFLAKLRTSPWAVRNFARKGGGEGGGGLHLQPLPLRNPYPQKLDFEKLHSIPPCVKVAKGWFWGGVLH